MTNEYRMAIAINYMVSVNLYRGQEKDYVVVYSFPVDCLDVAKKLWTAIPDAMRITISIPFLGADGIDWHHSDWDRGQPTAHEQVRRQLDDAAIAAWDAEVDAIGATEMAS